MHLQPLSQTLNVKTRNPYSHAKNVFDKYSSYFRGTFQRCSWQDGTQGVNLPVVNCLASA
nr:MAG TPA: hypothetical protein [Bacteriophage sp.]